MKVKMWVRDEEFGEDFHVDVTVDDLVAAARLIPRAWVWDTDDAWNKEQYMSGDDGGRDCVFLDMSDVVAALIAEGKEWGSQPMHFRFTDGTFDQNPTPCIVLGEPGRYLVFPIPAEETT